MAARNLLIHFIPKWFLVHFFFVFHQISRYHERILYYSRVIRDEVTLSRGTFEATSRGFRIFGMKMAKIAHNIRNSPLAEKTISQ